MNTDVSDAAAACLCGSIALSLRRRTKKQKQRSIWVKPWKATRGVDGAFHKLLKDLSTDPYHYKNFLRMDLATFELLLSEIDPLIRKQDTVMRKSISPAEQLAVTLRFLATGESYTSLQYQFRIGKATLSAMIPNVCNASSTSLAPRNIACPTTASQWEEVAQRFYQRWQLPNCLGAIDGKHVKILHPPGTGSDYFNYKGYFSIVLMAVVGPNSEFLFADVGCQGRISDGGVLKNTLFYQALEKKQLNLPQPKALLFEEDFHEWNPVLPYYFVGDDAFGLSENLMKPYPNRGQTEEQRICNYRLSRARRVSENAFGILSSRFRLYHKTLCVMPDNATSIVHATLILHNYLLQQCHAYTGTPDGPTCSEELSDGPPGNINNLVIPGGNPVNHKQKAGAMRDSLSDYVNGPGQVSWQWQILVP